MRCYLFQKILQLGNLGFLWNLPLVIFGSERVNQNLILTVEAATELSETKIIVQNIKTGEKPRKIQK